METPRVVVRELAARTACAAAVHTPNMSVMKGLSKKQLHEKHSVMPSIPKGLAARLRRARYSNTQGGDLDAANEADLIAVYEQALWLMLRQGRIDKRCMYEAIVNVQAEMEEELISASLSETSGGLTTDTFTPWCERKS